jgi:hypothetical protein
MRFDDGHGSVSIPEFIDFFVTPPSIRNAKAAASAVRMSLDLFSLDIELQDNIDPDDPNLIMDESDFEVSLLFCCKIFCINIIVNIFVSLLIIIICRIFHLR